MHWEISNAIKILCYTVPILWEMDCSITVYDIQIILKIPFMLALCLILSGIYYAKNYAGIICLGLII